MSAVESAPRQVGSIPTATAPVRLPTLREPMPRAWVLVASVAGLVAVVTMIAAVVIA